MMEVLALVGLFLTVALSQAFQGARDAAGCDQIAPSECYERTLGADVTVTVLLFLVNIFVLVAAGLFIARSVAPEDKAAAVLTRLEACFQNRMRDLPRRS